MADTSTRFQISEPSADRSDAADVPLYVRNVVAALEARGTIYGQGTIASRPTSSGGSPGVVGRFYVSTDESPRTVYWDYGTGWISVGSVGAGSIGTTQLADVSVTTAKIALLAVTAAQIAAGTITAAQIADNTITAAKLVDGIVPTRGAGGSTEALRALGTAAGTAAAGQHATNHAPASADALPWSTIHGSGVLSSRPSAGSTNVGYLYYATDTGALYENISSAWVLLNGLSSYVTSVGDGSSTSIAVTHSLGTQNLIVSVRENGSPYSQVYPEVEFTSTTVVTLIFDVAPSSGQYSVMVVGGAAAVVGTPAAHASTHGANGSDALAWGTIHGSGTLSSRPSAAAGNSGYRYFATDVGLGTEYQSTGSAWILIGSAWTTLRKVTAKTVNTTTTATDLLNGEFTVAAGVMGSAGRLRLTASGDLLNNVGSAKALWRFQLVFGGTTIFDTGTGGMTIAARATRGAWRLQAEINNLTAATQEVQFHLDLAAANTDIGTSNGAVVTTGQGWYGVATVSINSLAIAYGMNTSALDTTTSKTLVLNVINGFSDANYECKLYSALAEIL